MSRGFGAPSRRRRTTQGPDGTRLEALGRLLELGRRSKPLWFYPTLSLLAGLVLGFLMTLMVNGDYGPLSFLVYEGDPESARSFVSLAATSVATITSLSLTITVVTLQLASSQYSPRLIEHYLNDRGIRAVVSLFLMTFAFSVATLLNVRLPGDSDDAVGQVPGPAISLLVVLIVACLGALVFFVFRVTQSIRVEAILELVRDRTIEAIERRNSDDPAGDSADDIDDPDPDGVHVTASHSGFFVDLDRELIRTCDAPGSARVWIVVSPGDFVLQGTPVAVVSGWDPSDADVGDIVYRWLRFDDERWIEADYSYGVRSLTDVALKALSPGINDPTTAIMAIQRIAEVMAAAARSHPDRVIETERGAKVYATIATWESNLDQVLHQVALYGRDDVSVVTAVIRMLWSLLWVETPVDRRAQIAASFDRFVELIDVERPEPDQRLVDRQFELLRASLTGDGPVVDLRDRPSDPVG